jgi:rhodanese-related sulfurtransferase
VNIGVAQRINPQQFLLVSAVLLILFLLAQRATTQHYNVKSVSALQARQLIDSGAVVIDVRGEESYGERHIPGAVSIPLSSLERAIPASIANAKTKPMVVYCGDGVTVGPKGTSILNKAGFANAVNLQAGIQGWVDAGLPVESHNPSGA